MEESHHNWKDIKKYYHWIVQLMFQIQECFVIFYGQILIQKEKDGIKTMKEELVIFLEMMSLLVS